MGCHLTRKASDPRFTTCPFGRPRETFHEAGVLGPTMVAPQPHCHAAARDVSNDHSSQVDSCLGVPPAVNLTAVGWLNSSKFLGHMLILEWDAWNLLKLQTSPSNTLSIAIK